MNGTLTLLSVRYGGIRHQKKERKLLEDPSIGNFSFGNFSALKPCMGTTGKKILLQGAHQ
jgi:hypothetical protein